MNGTDVYSLMEAGATPNIMSPPLVDRLWLKSEERNKSVTVANWSRSGVLEKVTDFLEMLEDMLAKIDIVVLENVSFHMVIGTRMQRRLSTDLQIKREIVQFDYRGQKAVPQMIPKYIKPHVASPGTDSEDFTSDADVTTVSSEVDGEEKRNDVKLYIHSPYLVDDSKKRTGAVFDDVRKKLARLSEKDGKKNFFIVPGL